MNWDADQAGQALAASRSEPQGRVPPVLNPPEIGRPVAMHDPRLFRMHPRYFAFSRQLVFPPSVVILVRSAD